MANSTIPREQLDANRIIQCVTAKQLALMLNLDQPRMTDYQRIAEAMKSLKWQKVKTTVVVGGRQMWVYNRPLQL